MPRHSNNVGIYRLCYRICRHDSGCHGQKHPRKTQISNLTKIAWVSLTLAAAALIVSIIMKYQEKTEKDCYRFWALGELEFSTYKLLTPYLVNTDPPEASERYKLTSELIKIGMFKDFCTYKMADSCYCYPKQTYAQLAESTTRTAMLEMDGTLSRFANYLPSDIVELVTELRTDPWTEMMLNSNQRLQRVKNNRDYPFYSRKSHLQKLYLQKAQAYAQLIQKLEGTIGQQMASISTELHIKNPPPAFLLPLDR